MRVSELIKRLTQLEARHGDLGVLMPGFGGSGLCSPSSVNVDSDIKEDLYDTESDIEHEGDFMIISPEQ